MPTFIITTMILVSLILIRINGCDMHKGYKKFECDKDKITASSSVNKVYLILDNCKEY